MIYEKTKNKEIKEIKIFNEEFITNNKKRAKIIINNKQYELKEIVENDKQSFKIEIKFFDNIIYLNSMFKYCESLSGVYNFENFNTKYLKEIYYIFEGCNSLISINDISNWNIKNINY
jgi:surface protein